MSEKTYEELISEIKKLQQENKAKDIEIENLKLHINTLNRYIFGSKREATPKKEENIVAGTQCSIFGELKDEEIQKQVEEKTEEITVYRKKKNRKVQAGIKRAELKNVETVTEEYVLEENQLNCPECGSDLKKIGT